MEIQPAVDHPTLRKYKSQFTWQILLPIILVAVIGLIAGGLVIATTVSGEGQPRVWADVSIIWLITPVLLFALAFLVILITTIYGMAKLMQVLPRFTGKTQVIFAKVSHGTRKVADGTVKPFIWFHEAGAAINSLFHRS